MNLIKEHLSDKRESLSRDTYSQYLTGINRYCDKKLTITGLVILGVGLFVLLHSVFYGTNQSDDSFYLTIPYRVFLGDALFVDEWHVSQMSSVFQLLPLSVYVWITGSTDGIILFFRLLYVLCQALISVFVFYKMRKYGFVPAVFSSVIFLLYSPEFITTFNYYTMSLMALVILCMLLFTEEEITKFRLIFSGVLLACAVICEPTLALLFAVYIGAYIVFKLKKIQYHRIFTKEALLYICIGIGIAAIVFFAFIFSMETPAEFLAGIPNIFISKEYSDATIFVVFGELFKTLFSFRYLTVPSVAWVITTIVYRIKKKKRPVKVGRSTLAVSGLVIAFAFSVYFVIRIVTKQCTDIFFFNYIWFFLSLGFLILPEKRNRNQIIIWVVGFVYITALGIVSQATGYTGFTGAVITQLMLAPSLFGFMNELKGEKKQSEETRAEQQKKSGRLMYILPEIVFLFVFLVYSVSFSYLLSSRDFTSVFTQTDQSQLEVECRYGPFKGIKISEKQSSITAKMIADIRTIEAKTDGPFTIAAHDATWLQLVSTRTPANFTSWYGQSDIKAFPVYYEKTGITPTAIYFPWGNLQSGYLSEYKQINTTHLEYFKSLFDCETEEGKCGIILWINGWKDEAPAEGNNS